MMGIALDVTMNLKGGWRMADGGMQRSSIGDSFWKSARASGCRVSDDQDRESKCFDCQRPTTTGWEGADKLPPVHGPVDGEERGQQDQGPSSLSLTRWLRETARQGHGWPSCPAPR